MENNKLTAVISWLEEKKAENIRIYDVEEKSDYTDTIVVCEGTADIHNKAIASYLMEMAKKNHLQLLSKEGLEYGHWVLIDIGELIVHIFLPETREYYHIDDLLTKFVNKTS
ncbi:MAG TPA: ribosome silencing factor [Candidatus Cloacimonas sp.]|nr:ribosome silencing factor [Candidatus Cloacimonas sp.]MDD2250729.1 ribosome silencing factor [Candidatus Cloacimonadota bacterium]MCK9165006.1 ribosome silencing factor [Candidatus Cloacimonas sp.]MDD3733511.1 ribosome silencing factor [Candidatus Cloacimonadota bacterium]MDD3869890.1 ribosome silencing factor [Candidatus Cloacimonadota bacterium]